MKVRLQSYARLLPALWLAAVPWLLFPSIAPGLTAVSLVLLLLLLFLPQRPFPFFPLPATSINGYLLIFLALTGAAYLVSPLPQVSLPKLTVIILGVITFYLILPRLNNADMVERLVAVLAICAGLVALAGFFTLEWPERQIINLQPITERLPHLSGSFSVNYNEMAGTLLLFFPFVGAALRKGDGRFKKMVFSFHLLILISLLFFTQSRGAVLGLVVIGLTWRLWGRIPLGKILAVILILCLALLLISLLLDFSPAGLFDWFATIDAGSKQGDVPATSWLTRVEIWRAGGQLLADYPVIGSGLYTFDPVSRANYLYETILPSFNLTHAHNLFLQTGSSLGISGLLALAGIWATVLIRLWQAGRSENEQLRRLAAVFAAATVGYLFFNLFDTITFGQKPGLLAWIILVSSIGLAQLAEGQAAVSQPAPAKTSRLHIEKLVAFLPLLALVILLLSPALRRNLANLRLDQARLRGQTKLTLSASDFPGDPRRAGLVHHLAGDDVQAIANWQLDPQGAAFLQSQGTIALMSDDPTQAISWYDLALEMTPESAETYLWRGIANEERGTPGLAEADYWKAVAYSAESELNASTIAYIHYRLGALLADREAWPAAAEAFAQATVYEPEESWYYQLLGDALTELGDEPGAAAAYLKAEE